MTIKSKLTIYMVLSFAVFGFAKTAQADYYAEGVLASGNILSGADVSAINGFQVIAAVPAGTAVGVKFSQDKVHYYNSAGVAEGWDNCANGTTDIDLSGGGLLNWTDGLLFYKIHLTTTDINATPIVSQVQADYDGTAVPPISGITYWDQGILESNNLLSGATVTAINSFGVTADLSPGTFAFVKFSKDRVNYSSAAGGAEEWTSLADGINNVDLSGLGWTDASLYYKIKFESPIDNALQPSVSEVNLDYDGTSGIPPVGDGYQKTGTLFSTDLLSVSGRTLTDADRFGYAVASLPYGTTISAQFSQDGTNWYSSDGTLWGSDTLVLGDYWSPDAAMSLATLNWVGATSFYYKLTFTTDIDEYSTPILKKAGLVQYGAEIGTTGEGTALTMGTASEYCVPGDSAPCAAPIAEWSMDEKSGGTAFDSSGNGDNGTLTSGATWSKGKYGSGVRLDGINDRVAVNTAITFGSNSGSISFWYKDERPADSSVILTYAYNDFTELGLVYYTTTKFRFYLNQNYVDLTSAVNLWDNSWHHLTVYWDTDNKVRLYMDGKFQDEDNITAGEATATSWTISGGSSDLMGIVDEFRIYNYARTPAQIAWEYNKGKPIAEYRFNECQGLTIHDESGNGNNGTINLGASGNTTPGTCTAPTDGTGAWYDGRSGKYGASLDFDGGDDYVSITNPASGILDFGASGDFSISVWVKAHGDTLDRIINKWANSNSQGWILDVNSTINGSAAPGYIRFRMRNSTGNNLDYGVDANIDDGNWHHIVVLADRDSATGVKIYNNGAQIGISQDPTLIGNISNAESVGIGVLPSVLGNYFDGQIDDVKIFNYALTAEQVKVLYANGAVSF